MTPGYDALRNGAGLIDLSDRGRIRVTGEDRGRLLHAMTTNHVQEMKPGDGLYAFFLNAQGRILADCYILCFEDHFLLDTEPATRRGVFEHIDRYIIADDATLEDITDQTFSLGVEGPRAIEIVSSAALPAPQDPFTHVRWGEYSVAAISFTGASSIRIYGPVERKEEIAGMIEAVGALAASDRDAETSRIEHFKPRYGIDISEHSLPQETQQMHALHFQKGCYLGQEIVERIRSRGRVNRLLMGFRMESGPSPEAGSPEAGSKILFEGKEAGEVSSAAASQGGVFGLAYVRAPAGKPGNLVEIAGRPAELFAPAGV